MAVVLLAALDKLSDICNRIRDLPAKGQGDYSAALCIAVRKRVPDFQLIVALFNRLATDDSLAEDQMEIDDSDDDANDHENDSTLLAIGILRIIKRYLDLFQDVVSEEKFDFGRLMRMLPKMTTPKSDLLQLSIMEIIYQVSDQFQWYKSKLVACYCIGNLIGNYRISRGNELLSNENLKDRSANTSYNSQTVYI
jgi:hypothetical protein